MLRLSGIRLTYTEEDKNYVHVEQKNVINVCDTLQYFSHSALARCITLMGVLYVQFMATHLQWDCLFYFVSTVRFSFITIVLNRSRFKLMCQFILCPEKTVQEDSFVNCKRK